MLKAFSRRFSGSGMADRQGVEEEVHAFVMDLNKPMGITAKDKTLLITKVERRSFADAGGVVPGDRVSSVGGIDVFSIADLKAALTECRDRGDREVVICCEVGASSLTSKEVRRKKAKASKSSGRRSSWGGILLPTQPSSDANFAAALKLAEGGDAAAQHTVGVAYHKGLAPSGSPEDEGSSSAAAMAVHWWSKAAAQNYAPSQVSLGTAHYTSRGTGCDEPNYDEAVRLWQKAATSGSADALVNLACMYLEGRCVPRSGDTAVRLLEEAGSWGGLGDVTADLLLANLLEIGGAGVAKDVHRALQLYAKAAADGNPRAAESLERLRAHKPKQQPKTHNSSPIASMPLYASAKTSSLSGDKSGELSKTSATAQPLILDVVEVADADDVLEERQDEKVIVPPQAAATTAGPARKTGSMSTSELAAANAARTAAQRSAREKKERERLARLQGDRTTMASNQSGGEEMAGTEAFQRVVSTAELKESVAEGLRSIVYMSPEVLFRGLLDGKKAKEVDAEQLAIGLAKYIDFALKSTDMCVLNVLREIAGEDVVSSMDEEDSTAASSPPAPALDAPASISSTTFTLADLKERWHVVAGGAPKALSAAQKRAKKAADEKASRDR